MQMVKQDGGGDSGSEKGSVMQIREQRQNSMTVNMSVFAKQQRSQFNRNMSSCGEDSDSDDQRPGL